MNRLFLFFLAAPYVGLAQTDILEQEIRSKGKSIETVDWINKTISPLKKTDNLALEKYANISLKMAEELAYKRGMGEAFLLLGISYWQRDLHEPAMEYYLEALKLFQETGDKSKQAVVLTNIGNTYDELGQTARAKTYIINALQVFRQLEEHHNISKTQTKSWRYLLL